MTTTHQDSLRMMRGAVDLDGVVALTYQKFIREAKRRYGLKLDDNHQFSHYDLSVGTDVEVAHMIEIFGSQDFYADLPTMEYAVDALNTLYDAGFQLSIITSRPNNPFVRPETLRWIAANNIPFDSIHILTKHNTYEGAADAKGVVASGLGLGWAVEDSPTNARTFARTCDVVFLVNASYNVNEEMPENVIRINNLQDMAQYLLEDKAMRELSNSKLKQERAA